MPAHQTVDANQGWLTLGVRQVAYARANKLQNVSEGSKLLAVGCCSAIGANQSRRLDPFDCREPGRSAVVVVSRLNAVRFDGGDIPSIAGVERRSQLFLTDGVRASIGTIVTEAQHIQGSIVLGHRRETRHVSWS